MIVPYDDRTFFVLTLDKRVCLIETHSGITNVGFSIQDRLDSLDPKTAYLKGVGNFIEVGDEGQAYRLAYPSTAYTWKTETRELVR